MKFFKGIRLKLFYLLLSVVILSGTALAVYGIAVNYIADNMAAYIDESQFFELEEQIHEYGIEEALFNTDLDYERADLYNIFGDRVISMFPFALNETEPLIIDGENQVLSPVEGESFDYDLNLPENIDEAFYMSEQELLYPYYIELDSGEVLILYVPEIYESTQQVLFQNLALFVLGITVILILITTSFLGSRFFIKPIDILKKGVLAYEKGEGFDFTDLKDDEYILLGNTIEEMTSKLHEEEDKRKQLILDLAHDIKTPLTSVMGYAETMQHNEQMTSDEQSRYLDVIYKNSHRANEIVKNIYDLTAMDTGQEFHMQLENFSELLRESVILHVSEFERFGLDYGLHIPDEDVYALIDRHQMERVFANLFGNACKYLEPGNRLDLFIKIEKNRFMFIYEDDGPGISEDLNNRLFDPFVKGDFARSEHDSKGLGLSIVKKIIERHGGTIMADASYTKGLRLKIGIKSAKLTKNAKKN